MDKDYDYEIAPVTGLSADRVYAPEVRGAKHNPTDWDAFWKFMEKLDALYDPKNGYAPKKK